MSPAALILAVAAVFLAVAALIIALGAVIAARVVPERLSRERHECDWCQFWAVVRCSCPVPCRAPHCGAREVRR